MLFSRSLGIGGAEKQLVILAKGLYKKGHEVSVVVFYANGHLEKELHEIGIPVIDLRKSGRWDVLPFFLRLVNVVKEIKPWVIYGFLGTPNILSAFLKPIFPNIRMVWGVRASNMDLERYDWLARASYRLERKLSGFADLIICNSYAGLEYAATHGFPRGKMIVIQNGIDTEHFKPDAAARERVRKVWGVLENDILIGLVARLDPMKDHTTFLRAAEMLTRENPNIHFVCVGDGPESYRTELLQLAADLGLNEKLIWAGVRHDMPAVFNALDIASSSSYGEGFSNAIAEAMACGVPCVVTDVGDSALIVGELGIIVPPFMPDALCEAFRMIQEKLRPDYREAVRTSIVKRFASEVMVSDTRYVLCNMYRN